MINIHSIDTVGTESFQNFSCGNLELDHYLKIHAMQNHKKGIGKSFVAINNEEVIGFYTISMCSIEFIDLLDLHKKGMPKYPIPAAKIGRLAVDLNFQSKKIGTVLLIDALKRIKEASMSVAAFAIVVDAKNQSVKQFYKSFGFLEYKNEFSMYLPIKTVYDLFK